jgi:hypothetical protein
LIDLINQNCEFGLNKPASMKTFKYPHLKKSCGKQTLALSSLAGPALIALLASAGSGLAPNFLANP